MGFYNVLQGDMPYFKQLADNYSMSDNYHQPAMGGPVWTGIMPWLWRCDLVQRRKWQSCPTAGKCCRVVADTPADTGTVNEIENPNPVPDTNNWWEFPGRIRRGWWFWLTCLRRGQLLRLLGRQSARRLAQS